MDLTQNVDECILLVGAEFGYLLNSIKELLMEESFAVTLAADIADIEKVDKMISAILIYADEQLLINQKLFVYLKDKATEEDIPIFVVGVRENLDMVKEAVEAGADIIMLDNMSPEQMKEAILENDWKECTILVKGSNKMNLNQIVNTIKEKYEEN